MNMNMEAVDRCELPCIGNKHLHVILRLLIYTSLPQWAHCLVSGCGVPSLPGTHPQYPLSYSIQWHWRENRTLHTYSLYHCMRCKC